MTAHDTPTKFSPGISENIMMHSLKSNRNKSVRTCWRIAIPAYNGKEQLPNNNVSHRWNIFSRGNMSAMERKTDQRLPVQVKGQIRTCKHCQIPRNGVQLQKQTVLWTVHHKLCLWPLAWIQCCPDGWTALDHDMLSCEKTLPSILLERTKHSAQLDEWVGTLHDRWVVFEKEVV